MSFWGELKRRNVFKVGAAYVIVAWLILQVAAITFPVLHLPGWALTLVTVLLIIGFPLILLFAWAFEITPDGIKRTEHVPQAESITHLTGRKLNYIVTGLLVIAVAYILFDKFYLDRRAAVTEVPTTAAEQASAPADGTEAPKTIAVLPFVNRSPDPEQEYFVEGLSEEILNCLAQIKGLSVTSSTSCFAFKDSGKTIHEVADLLGVAYILEGSARKSGDELRITAQLIRAADDVHLWSDTYDRELKDIFAIQEDIATAVAGELKVALGIGYSFSQPGGTDNIDAYELYLVAQGQVADTEYSLASTSLDAALAIDPDFALAWASKATLHIFNTVVGPAKDVVPERQEGLDAATRAVGLEPDLAAGYYALGYVNTTGGDYIAGMKAYRRALDLSETPLSFIVPVVAIHYQSVGYFKKEKALLEEMLRHDPLNQGTRGFLIWCLGCLGEIEKAEAEYERACALFGDEFGVSNPSITFVRLGSGKPISSDGIIFPDPALEAVKTHLESPETALAALRRLYADGDELNNVSLQMIVMSAAYFGDPEFAMEVMEKSVGFVAESKGLLWQPVMKDVRKLPRFKEFMRKIGQVEYWNEFGWPDICRPTGDGDFECE